MLLINIIATWCFVSTWSIESGGLNGMAVTCKTDLEKLNDFQRMCNKAGHYALLESFTDLTKKPFRTMIEQEALAIVRAEIIDRMRRN
jgi:hypothetical protein